MIQWSRCYILLKLLLIAVDYHNISNASFVTCFLCSYFLEKCTERQLYFKGIREALEHQSRATKYQSFSIFTNDSMDIKKRNYRFSGNGRSYEVSVSHALKHITIHLQIKSILIYQSMHKNKEQKGLRFFTNFTSYLMITKGGW